MCAHTGSSAAAHGEDGYVVEELLRSRHTQNQGNMASAAARSSEPRIEDLMEEEPKPSEGGG